MEMYTGFREISVKSEVIDELYQNKFIDLTLEERKIDKRLKFQNQNEYVLLKTDDNQSAIARVKSSKLVLIGNKELVVNGIKPRNLHQRMLFDALLDDSIKVVVITGRAGTGKTLMSIVAALNKMEQKIYRRLIFTKPMSQVGKYNLGILPGEVTEKYSPYLDNYMDNIEHLLGGRYKSTQDLIAQYRMDFKPLQLIRGASWQGAFVILDEAQILTHHETVTVGTRVAEGSKIIIMGDLGQKDENIPTEKTGMYKLVNDPIFKESKITANIELQKCERGVVAELFADIFGV